MTCDKAWITSGGKIKKKQYISFMKSSLSMNSDVFLFLGILCYGNLCPGGPFKCQRETMVLVDPFCPSVSGWLNLLTTLVRILKGYVHHSTLQVWFCNNMPLFTKGVTNLKSEKQMLTHDQRFKWSWKFLFGYDNMKDMTLSNIFIVLWQSL